MGAVRILLVNSSARAHTGGVHRMVVESCEWIERAGHTVALAYYDGGPSEVTCATFRLPQAAETAVLRPALEKVLEEWQPEVLQLHLARPPFFIREVGDLIPTCRFIHDQSWFCSGGDRMRRDFTPCHRPHGWQCLLWHYAQGCGGKNPLGNLDRWRQVDPLHAVRGSRVRLQVASEFMRRGLLENHYPEGQIDVLPLFAVPAFTVAPLEPGLLLVASRLIKGKGVDFLLRALTGLKQHSWRLVIAGTGPQHSALEQMSRESGLEPRVQFLGELSPRALESWYARCQVVISPVVRPEPFGLVGLEAMAHGKPIVAIEGGATEEWLADGETGILVRERTPCALNGALCRLLSDPELSERLGRNARRRWEQYRPEIYVARLVASFDRCIQRFRQTAI
jgi:glycosyltransferase involved in cell wall biosynthesis